MLLLIDFQSPIFFVLYILLGFGAIALIAFLCRKYIPGLKPDKTEIDEKKVAEEELIRILVPMDKENVEKNQEEVKDNSHEGKKD